MASSAIERASSNARFVMLTTWLGTAAMLLFVPVPPCRQFFLLHGVQIGLLNYAGNNRDGLRWLPIANVHFD